MSLIDRPVRELIAAFRSPTPAPGGGSAAALAGAVGAALLAMVASLPRPRVQTPEDAERLNTAGRDADGRSEALTSLVERDADAYQAVMAAYKLPKGTEEETRTRSAQIQTALSGAIDVPLEVMRHCAAALAHAPVVASLGNANASTDAQVGIELLRAGLRGAALNVEINLGSLKDAARAEQVRSELEELLRSSS